MTMVQTVTRILRAQRASAIWHRLILTALIVTNGSLGAAEQGNPWTFLKEEDGIRVFSRDINASPLLAVRGETTIHAPIGKILSAIRDIANRGKWVDYVSTAKIIQENSSDERVEYVLTERIGPVSPRDFVYRVTINLDASSKTAVLASESVDSTLAPTNSDAIRAYVKSTTTLTALDATKTSVSVEAMGDPKGLIPKWIVNIVQKSSPVKTLSRLRKRVQKMPDTAIEPRFVNLFISPPLSGSDSVLRVMEGSP